MEKLDKVLQKEVNSNKKLSKNFIQFLRDRNNDCSLYDDILKGIENRVSQTEVTIRDYVFQICGKAIALIIAVNFGLVTGFLYSLPYGEVISIIAAVVMLSMCLLLGYRLLCLTMPVLAHNRVKNCKDSWLFLVCVNTGMSYKDYKSME